MVTIYKKIGPWGNVWNLHDIATWGGVGITLDTLANEFRIVSFNFHGNFHGSIPYDFSKLAELRHLSISGGSLNGHIPSWIGDLTKLEYLYIGNNQIEGKIPPSIGKLTRLKQLILGNNYINSKIPNELGELYNLEILTIMNTHISGEIPKSLSKLKNIRQINLIKNQLSGEFPIEILKPATTIDCSYNKIKELSFKVWKMDNICLPDLQQNRLTGVIPDWVKKTNNWKKFHFYIENQQKSYGYSNI